MQYGMMELQGPCHVYLHRSMLTGSICTNIVNVQKCVQFIMDLSLNVAPAQSTSLSK